VGFKKTDAAENPEGGEIHFRRVEIWPAGPESLQMR
jgi:hypothetical protein